MIPRLRRLLIILWPLWSAPIVGFTITTLSGPRYDGTVNQNALAFRFLAVVAWGIALLVGLFLTLLLLKDKKPEEVLAFICSGIAGSAAVWFIVAETN